MRAFMRMFMDLVGIFSDDQGSSQDAHSSGGVPFGMSHVGSLPSDGAEEWSTEDEDEEDDDDDSEGDDDAEENIFEPMAKSYYHMNLKEAAGDEQREAEEEIKRKLKNAKKKTEKRRKQKEKKQKENAEREEEEERARAKEEQARRQQEEQARLRKEELRRAQEREALRRVQLFQDAAGGRLEELKQALDNSTMKCTERVSEGGSSGAGLVHYALDPRAAADGSSASSSSGSADADSASTRDARLKVASYLLHMKSPAIDLSVLDEAGCNILHVSSRMGDVDFVDLILAVRSESHERRNQLDPNARCLTYAYTALHYAAEGGHFAACSRLIDCGVLLNIHATYISNPKGGAGASNAADGAEKGPTPLDLATTKMAQNGISASKKEEYRNIIQKLTGALGKIENARIAKEKEKLAKEAKHRAEKEAQLLKEQEERELLDRKQRQLKEKQEKISRLRDAAEPAAVGSHESAASGGAVGVDVPGSAKKKKKEKKKAAAPADNKRAAGDASASSLDSSLPSADQSAGRGAHSSGQQAQGQGHQRNRSDSSGSVGSGSGGPSKGQGAGAGLQSEEMNSRADLLAMLLAMGFPEDQCHAAIASCGLNADLAISWIVDRPAPRAAPKPVPVRLPAAASAAAAADYSAKNEAELREKALKEKEKLRRINREWNAKVPQVRAEEERKKVPNV
jgi:hypothetical protein